MTIRQMDTDPEQMDTDMHLLYIPTINGYQTCPTIPEQMDTDIKLLYNPRINRYRYAIYCIIPELMNTDYRHANHYNPSANGYRYAT